MHTIIHPSIHPPTHPSIRVFIYLCIIYHVSINYHLFNSIRYFQVQPDICRQKEFFHSMLSGNSFLFVLSLGTQLKWDSRGKLQVVHNRLLQDFCLMKSETFLSWSTGGGGRDFVPISCIEYRYTWQESCKRLTVIELQLYRVFLNKRTTWIELSGRVSL
jgi:hypothetical protein